MHNTQIESVAFRQAHLKSERLRLLIVLGVLGIAFLLRSVRILIHGGAENVELWLATLGVLAPFAAYEFLMLLAVNRAHEQQRELPNAAWIGNILAENILPALGIVFTSSSSIDPTYRALAHPSVLAFFLFINLSTLRLNPALCRLSGLVAAVSYLTAALFLGWKPSFAGGTSLLSPQKAVFDFALEFVIGGFVAGLVAGEIRKQVDAALREAETRLQVDRLEHDLAVAKSIQQSLLPSSMPQVEGYEIAAWNQPADQTGGDYYDWQFLPDGNVVVALADVTGHGIGPALLAAVCRAYARASFKVGNGLLAAMDELNGALAQDIGEGRFVTFVAAVCSSRSSHVELLSAGHGPLLVYKVSHDQIDETEAQGLPLGILPNLVTTPPVILDFHPGDILVLATDGFFEWANPKGDQFGARRIGEIIRQAKEKPPRELISAMYQAVIEFSEGTGQQDDLTAVVLKRV
jgi:serine phosphatase RsbU (regulator of sigma subunit)